MEDQSPFILTLKNCQIKDIHIDTLDVAVFQGTFADTNSVKYPKVTFELLNGPDVVIEPTTTGYYRDAYGFTKPSQILMSIIQYVAEYDMKETLLSDLIQNLIRTCEHDGCVNIQIGKNEHRLILPYTGLPYGVDYRFSIVKEMIDEPFKTVYFNGTDITSKIDFDPFASLPSKKASILPLSGLLIAEEPHQNKIKVREDNWSIIDELIVI